MPSSLRNKKGSSLTLFVRHKRLELSLLAEPDPKSGASTNSANAARLISKAGAKVRRFFGICKKIRKLFIIFCQMASKSCIDGRLLLLRMWV